MNKVLIFICLVAVGVAVALGRLAYDRRQTEWQAVADLKRTQGELKLAKDSLQVRDNTAKALEKKLTQLTDVLNQTTTHLNTANDKLKILQEKEAHENQARVAAEKQKSDLARLKAEVPAPIINTKLSASGKELRTYRFPRLLAVSGQTLATDVDFGDIYGRRMVFRRQDGPPLAFDVDEIHPGVLMYLGISAEAAKRTQVEQEEQIKKLEEVHRQELAARHAAEQKAAEELAKLQLEYAKLNEQRRHAMVEEQQKAAEIQRLKAESAMRSADAAMRQALAPYFPDSFIQQYFQNQGGNTMQRN